MEEVQQGEIEEGMIEQISNLQKEISALSERLYGIKTGFGCE